jgi:hypothetical protein
LRAQGGEEAKSDQDGGGGAGTRHQSGLEARGGGNGRLASGGELILLEKKW